MKKSTVIKRLNLDEKKLETIALAVTKAETTTTGEIALAATDESSDYSFFELLAAVIFGALVFSILLPFHGNFSALLDLITWVSVPWHLSAFYGIISFSAIALFFLIANIPAIDRIIVPHFYRSKAVYRRALRHFVESGVYATSKRTGILIFISVLEKEVRIIADSGISTRIDQKEWDSLAGHLAKGIQAGTTEKDLIEVIERCGKLLTEHFPATDDNPNELSDGLVILEGGE